MIIKWYTLHPKDGNKAARSVSVGLPLEHSNQQEEIEDNSQKEELQEGVVVPEADREV